MLDQHLWGRIRTRRFTIFAIITTTIILLTAAGLEAAAFSSTKQARSTKWVKRTDRLRSSATMPVTACTTTPTGMVNWWPANGNPDDIYGAKNATLFNGAGYVPGRVGQAFNFDGIDDYAVVPASSDWAFGNGDFTVEFWMYSGTNDTRRPIVNNRATPASDSFWAIEVYDVANRVEFHSGLTVFLTASTTLNSSSWNHVAVTRSGTTLTIYINGTASGSVSNATNFSSVNDLQIGRDVMSGNDLGGHSFQGQIDELSIYHSAVSASEIAAIYNAAGGKCSGCVPAPNGMISIWPGENNPLDTQGRNNAVLHGDANYVSGKVGSAFDLDGSGDYIQIASPTGLPLGNAPRTVELWFKAPATPGESGIFQYGSASNSNMFGLITSGNAPGKMYFYGHNADLATATTIQPNTWYHGAVTYDGSTLKLYINGQLENSAPIALNTVPESNGVTIGYRVGGASWAGQIDEPAIFDRALSSTEIAAIYNAGSAGICTTCTPAPVGLVSWWTGDGNGIDSRNVNNGTLQNGATYAPGKVGPAFSFNGANQHVAIPDSPSLRPVNGITLSGWFMFNTASPQAALISKPYQSGASNAYVLWIQGGQLYASIAGAYLGGPFAPVPGQWYYIAYTYDNATSQHYIYVDGNEFVSAVSDAAPTYDAAPLLIGMDSDNGSPVLQMDGKADEVGIYGRAITLAEIRALVAAGNLGICRPTATTPPAGVVGWWGGDGFRNDFPPPGNFATLVNGAGYAVGKVSQAFSLDGVDDYIEVANSIYDPGTNAFSVEFWLRSRNNGAGTYLIGKSHPDGGQGWDIRLDNNRIQLVGVNGWGINLTSDASVTANAWHHIAMSSTDTMVSLYVDGVLKGTCPRSVIGLSVNPLRFGFTSNFGGTALNGFLDEITLYNRAITPAEIQAIVNAGLAGKLKQMATLAPATMRKVRKTSAPNDTGVYAFPGDATIFFPAVTATGMTQQIPLDPALLPPLPLRTVGLTYDIATSAQYTGTLTVCFNLPSFTSTEFATLHILHLEIGGWVDRTYTSSAYPSLCAVGLTSLSPFAIVTTAPTAAELSIAGRVVTAEGRGIRGAVVTVTGTGGDVHNVPTGNLGRYVVGGLNAGETYIVTVRSRRFTFAQPTMVITLNDNVMDADFIGSTGTGREQ